MTDPCAKTPAEPKSPLSDHELAILASLRDSNPEVAEHEAHHAKIQRRMEFARWLFENNRISEFEIERSA